MLQPIFRIFKRFLPESVKQRILRSDNASILALRGIASHPTLLAGKLTVVVPVYNVEEHLDECLDSLQNQNYPNLEVLIIDDGSPDASATIAQKYVSTDKRFKLIQQQNQGLGGARNTGIRHATGDFITFVDSDDVVPKNAYLAMMESLNDSGSDFVVGAIERLTSHGTRRDHWAARVHASDRQGITLDDLPEMTKNVFACNKVFRKAFFDKAVKSFPIGVYYEDQAPTARAMVQARKFDVIHETTYFWRIRDDGSSITQNKIRIKDLNDRSAVLFEVQKIYQEQATPAVYRYWLAKSMGMDLSYYFEIGPRATEEYWRKLVDTTKRLASFLDAETWLSIRARQRIPALLVLNAQREKLVQFYGMTQSYRSGLPVFPSKIQENPVVNSAMLGLESELFSPADLTLSDNEYELKAVVFRLEWVSQTQLEVNAFIYLPTHDVSLCPNLKVNAHTSKGVHAIEVEPLEHSLTNELEIPFDSFHTYRESAVKFVIDVEELREEKQETISFTPQFKSAGRVWEAQFTATTQLRVPTASRPTDFKGQIYYPTLSSGHGFEMGIARGGLIVTDMEASEDRHLLLRFVPNSLVTKARLHERVTGRTVPIRLRTSEDGSFKGSLHIPNMNYRRVGHEPYIWKLEYKTTKQPWAVAVRGQLNDEAYDSVAGGISINREPQGEFWLEDTPWVGRLTNVSLDPRSDRLTLSLKCAGSVASNVGLSLRTRKGVLLPSIKNSFDHSNGILVSTFELLNEEGPKKSPTRSISGWVEVCGAVGGDEVTQKTYPLILDEQGKMSSPRMVHSASTTVWVTSRGYKSAAQLRISPRVEPDSLGFAGRFNLISAAKARAVARGINERLAVVSSFNGSNTYDGVRPVAQQLLQGGHVDRVVWVVSDGTVQVPDGHEKVLLHSEAFTEVLHSAKYLINNNNFPHYFEKQQQQIYCQLWHGTPLKKIGEDVPGTSLSYSYRELMKREAAAWDLLIGQSEEATRLLEGAFRYSGHAIATGYPRNDILADKGNLEELRNLTRQHFGIAPGQYCILYAPTWRDNLRSSQGYDQVDFLDEDLLTTALDRNTVLLRRGHFNTLNSVSNVSEDNIIDVTQFENLNALIAASDCLITDYSSIMFDYVVANKPIFLFAPDRDEYIQETRGTYFDYDAIAPSTITATTEELIKEINDNPDGVSEKQQQFHNRFAPYDDGQATLRVVREIVNLSANYVQDRTSVARQ